MEISHLLIFSRQFSVSIFAEYENRTNFSIGFALIMKKKAFNSVRRDHQIFNIDYRIVFLINREDKNLWERSYLSGTSQKRGVPTLMITNHRMHGDAHNSGRVIKFNPKKCLNL